MGGGFDLPTGTHACCWFDSEEQRQTVVREFVGQGLDRRERVLVFTGATLPPVLDLRDPVLAHAARVGLLQIGIAEAAYFPDGRFDGTQRAADFATLAADTAAAGYPALRVYADNGVMPGLLTWPDDWLEYELRVAATVPQHPLIGLCGFSLADTPALPRDLLDAVHEHDLTYDERPSRFHVRGERDGSLTIGGEVETMGLDEFRRVVRAGRPVFATTAVSLRDVTFTDAAGATFLYRLATSEGMTVVEVPARLRRMWRVLGLTAA